MQNSLESNILLYKTAQGETRIEVIYSILPYFLATPSLSYCLRLPVGGSVNVMRTTAVRERERAMLWSKAWLGSL